MPASLSPPRSSSSPLTSLSLEAEAFPGPSAAASLDTALPTVPAIPEAAGAEEDGQDGKKKKNRCASCKKKLGLTGFTCRCGELFCSIHRYSDKHQCGFDYKALGAEEIQRSNPVVVAQKVAKI